MFSNVSGVNFHWLEEHRFSTVSACVRPRWRRDARSSSPLNCMPLPPGQSSHCSMYCFLADCADYSGYLSSAHLHVFIKVTCPKDFVGRRQEVWADKGDLVFKGHAQIFGHIHAEPITRPEPKLKKKVNNINMLTYYNVYREIYAF